MIRTLLVLFLLSMCSFASEVKVGVLLRLGDKYNTFPLDMLEAMQFYLAENKLEEKIQLVTESHNGTPDSLKRAVDKFISKDIRILIGGETSSDAILISKFTAGKGIVFVTPTASSQKVHLYNKSSFRMMVDESKMALFTKEVVSEVGCRKVGIYHNVTKPNTDSIAKKVTNVLSDNAIVVKALADHIDMKKLLKPFVSNKVDCLILFGFESDLRRVYSSLSSYEIHPIYIGGDGWGTNKNVYTNYVIKAKNKKFRAYRAFYWNSTRNDRFFLDKVKNYKKNTKKDMNAFSAIAYDTIHVLSETLKKVNTSRTTILKSAVIVDAMKNSKYTGLLTTRELRFNKDHSPNKDINGYYLDKDGVTFWRSIQP